jgi:hypothetical protein
MPIFTIRKINISDFNDNHYNKMIKALDKISITHEVIHIHGNNYGNYLTWEGIPVPETLEVTYLKKKGITFLKNTIVYPIKGLDQPNNPERAEFVLAFVNNKFMN